MNIFLENLPSICLFVALLICFVCAMYTFITMPRERQIAALKEWLKKAVVMAEKELGSGTGQLKLRAVYEQALNTFPWLYRIVSFEEFSFYVDEALIWMKEQLESNHNIAAFLNGERTDQNENK